VTPRERYDAILKGWVAAVDRGVVPSKAEYAAMQKGHEAFWRTLDDAMACVRLVAEHEDPEWSPSFAKKVACAQRVLKEMGEP
jgi:hypothetical protein